MLPLLPRPGAYHLPRAVPELVGLADWIAGVDLADPLLRQFMSDLRTLEATGADPRWAMIVLLRHAADLETQDRTADATLELAAA